MNIHKRARVILALASCLIAVPAANAAVLDNQPTFTAPGDDHARTTNVTPTTSSGPFAPGDDHARSTSVTPPASPPPTLQAGSFDWEDAGAGFGMAAALALLAGGTLVTSRKMRTPRTPAI